MTRDRSIGVDNSDSANRQEHEGTVPENERAIAASAGTVLDSAGERSNDESGDASVTPLQVFAPTSGDIVPLSATPSFAVELNEAHLNRGTSPSSEGRAKVITLPDGHSVDTSGPGWTQSGSTYVFEPEEAKGSFLLTYANGVLTCRLSSQYTHSQTPTGRNEAVIDLTGLVTFKDEKGESYEPELTVTLLDDIPVVTLTPGEESVTPGTTVTMSWTNEFGADGAWSGGSISALSLMIKYPGAEGFASLAMQVGIKGPLTIPVNGGTLTLGVIEITNDKILFTPDVNLPGIFQFFLYSIDGDGDQVASKTYSVLSHEVIIPTLEFDEANLKGGTDENIGALTKTIDIPAGYRVDTSSWDTNDNGDRVYIYAVNGRNLFSLQYDGAALTCTLLTNESHYVQGRDNIFSFLADIPFIREEDGKEIAVPIRYNIRDDAPTVDFSVDATTVEGGDTISGLWEVKHGADGEYINPNKVPTGSIIGVTLPGVDKPVELLMAPDDKWYALEANGIRYGAVRMGTDGQFHFTAAYDVSGEISFALLGVDAESDMVWSEPVVVTIVEKAPPPPPTMEFNEAFLQGGTQQGEGAVGYILTIPDNYSVDVEAFELIDGVYELIQGPFKLTYDGSELTCIFQKSYKHLEGEDTEARGTITLPLLNALGESAPISAGYVILDDKPVFTLKDIPDSVQAGDSVTGSIDVIFGADGAAGDRCFIIEVTFPGAAAPVTYATDNNGEVTISSGGVTYGVLRINKNQFTFIAEDEASGDLAFKLGAKDGDGDVTWSEEFAISITEPVPVEPVTLQEVQLDEAGLAWGSNADLGASIIVPLPDGYSLYTKDWGTENGVLVRQSDLFRLEFKDGVLTCILRDSYSHPEGQGSVTFTLEGFSLVSDATGLRHPAFLPIKLMDDSPSVTISGDQNVIAPGDNFTGTLAPVFGADREAGENAIRIDIVFADGSEATVYPSAGGGSVAVKTADGANMGTFILNSDYTFTFMPADSVEGRVSFKAIITDGDNDNAESSVINVSIGQQTEYLELGRDLTFSDSYLENGTESSLGRDTQTIALPQGASFVFEGDNRWEAQDDGSYHLMGKYGFFKAVTGPDGASLTYTQTVAADHSKSQVVLDEISGIKMLSAQGSPIDASLHISIQDDTPVVRNVSFDEPEGGEWLTGIEYTGRIDYSFGADGKANSGAIILLVTLPGDVVKTIELVPGAQAQRITDGTTDYGTVRLDQNETSFIFQSMPNRECELGFTIRVFDKDGDVYAESGTSIALKAPDNPTIQDGDYLHFYEDQLELGTAAGNEVSKEIPLPPNWTISTDPDLWQPGEEAGSFVLRGEYGHLTYYVDGNRLTYTLDENAPHAPDTDILPELFDIALKDLHGNLFSVPLNLTIHDDAPVLTFTGTGSGVVEPGGAYEGVWSVIFGADGQASLSLSISLNGEVIPTPIPVSSSSSTPIVINDITYGTLILDNESKSFRFVANEELEADATLSFVITATDGDGDPAATPALEVSIQGAEIPSYELTAADLVLENYLPGGTYQHLPNASDHLTVRIPLEAGNGPSPVEIRIDTGEGSGWAPISNFSFTREVPNGLLTYHTNSNELYFTLSDRVSHDQQGPDAIKLALADLKAFTMSGSPIIAAVSVMVQDDTPLIESFTLDGAAQGGTFEGNMAFAFGVDGPLQAQSVKILYSFGNSSQYEAVIEPGVEHTFTCPDATGIFKYENGRFTFTPEAGTEGYWHFELQVTDSEGDLTTSALTIPVGQKAYDGPEVITAKDAASLYENALPGGSNPAEAVVELDTGAYQVLVSEADGWSTADGGASYELAAANGKLICKDGKLFYQLTSPLTHSAEGVDSQSLDLGATSFTLQDAFGNTYLVGPDSGSVASLGSILVVDDVPEVRHSLNESEVEAGSSVGGSIGQLYFGADLQGEKPLQLEVTLKNGGFVVREVPLGGGSIDVVIDEVTFGSLEYRADGSYSFTAAEGLEDCSLSFVFLAQDGDGDTSRSNSVDLQIKGKGELPFWKLGDKDGEEIYEKDLPWGTEGEGKADDDYPVTVISIPDGYSIDTSKGGWEQDNDGWFLRSNYGILKYSNDHVLTYTLTRQFTHDAPQASELHDANIGKDSFNGVYLLDGQSRPIDQAILVEVRIVDDYGSASLTGPTESVVSGYDYSGQWEAVYGADGKGKLLLHVSNDKGSATIEIVENETQYITIDNENLGSIVMDSQGRYTFTAAPNTSGELGFELRVVDGDSDESRSAESLTVKVITPQGPIEVPPTHVPVDESALPGGSAPGQGNLATELVIPTGYTLVTDSPEWEPQPDNSFKFSLADGSGYLLYNGDDRSLVFVLEGRVSHSGAGRDTASIDIDGLVLQDLKDNTFVVRASIAVVDDVPLVELTHTTGAPGGSEYSGEWLVRHGADGAADEDATSLKVLVDGELAASVRNIVIGEEIIVGPENDPLGTLVFHDKTYTFTAAPGKSGQLTIEITARDQEDDTTSQSQVINVTSETETWTPEFNLYEAKLADGTGIGEGGISYTVPLPDGYSLDLSEGWEHIEGNTYTMLLDEAFGFLEVLFDGKSITCTLNGNIGHAGTPGSLAFILPEIAISDENGKPVQTTLKVVVHDDSPIADLELPAGLKLSPGEDWEGGSWLAAFGADGKAQNGAVKLEVLIDGEYISFEVPEDGNVRIEHNAVHYGDMLLNSDSKKISFSIADDLDISQKVPLEFMLRVTDGDDGYALSGEDKASLVLVPKTPMPLNPFIFTEAFEESALPWGTEPDTNARSKTITVDPAFELVLDGWTFADGVHSISVEGGALAYNEQTRALTYTLDRAFDNQAGDSFTVAEIDVDHATGRHSFGVEITVSDDTPVFNIANGGDAELGDNGDFSSIGQLGILLGADMAQEATSFVLQLAYSLNGAPADTGELTIPLDGSEVSFTTALGSGTLSYDAASGRLAYRYEAERGEQGDRESLRFSFTDDDGSQADVSMTFTLTRPVIEPSDGLSLVSQYNPGYDDAALFGSFTSAFEAGGQGWLCNNASWNSSLPESMLPFPKDPDLDAFADGKSIRLQSATMSKSSVAAHIGEDNSLADILRDIGIETCSQYVGDSDTSRLALTSKSFTGQGGEIAFNWSFSGRCWAGESDAAFWILLDADGAVVDSGKIAHLQTPVDGVQYANGITRITLPEDGAPADYRLVIGSVDGGSANSSSARLNVETAVLLTDQHLFSGNIFSENLSGGAPYPGADAYIQSVSYENTTYTFEGGPLNIPTGSGMLTIQQTGEYSFKADPGASASPISLTYNIGDRNGDTVSLEHSLRWDSPKAEDNFAVREHGFANVDRLGIFESGIREYALDGQGWYRSGNVYTGRSPAHQDTYEVPVDDILAPYYGEPNPWVRICASDNITASAREVLFGTRDAAQVKEILQDAGIQGDSFGYKPSSTSINGAAIQKSFTSTGGEIRFGWSFRSADNEGDAAFWLLKDKAGNIISSGTLCQGQGKGNGIISIAVPPSSGEEEYSLVLGAVNVGNTSGENPYLYVGNILLLADEYHFKGNVITDASADGQIDVAYADTRLESVTYRGQTKYFDEHSDKLVFDTPQGLLTVARDGGYWFKAPGDDASTVAEKFSYTLNGAQSGDSAEVIIQQISPLLYDKVADYTAGELSVTALGTFSESLADSGWAELGGYVTSNVVKPAAYAELPENELLQAFSDSALLRLSTPGALRAEEWSQALGDNGPALLAGVLAKVEAKGNPVNPADPEGAFTTTGFSSMGGQLVFNWSHGGRAQADKDMDAAVWVLRDEAGNIIDQGLISQLLTDSATGVSVYQSGICELNIPYSLSAKNYSLTIGVVQMGNDNPAHSHLYLGTVVQVEAACLFAGNVLSDASPLGEKSILSSGMQLGSVSYNGEEFSFLDADSHSIATRNGGTLTIQKDGAYAFVHPDGPDAAILEDFSYTVSGSDGKSTATLYLRSDEYKVEGSAANDVLDRSSSDAPLLVEAGLGDDVVTGGRGDDVIYGGDGNDLLNGGSGNDIIYGGSGDDTLNGGEGNDILYGGSGNDILNGGLGNDLLYGGAGDNTLTGGGGADTFAWKHVTDLSGTDVITDFNTAGGNKLSFSDLLAAGEDLDDYLGSHISGLSLNTEDAVLHFTISDGAYAKNVELCFSPADSGYQQLQTEYLAADANGQQDILSQYLLMISS